MNKKKKQNSSKEFANKLRLLRNAKGWSQLQVAKKVERDRQRI